MDDDNIKHEIENQKEFSQINNGQEINYIDNYTIKKQENEQTSNEFLEKIKNIQSLIKKEYSHKKICK